MGTPKAVVLRAAGINCDQESKSACEKAGFQADVVHVNRFIEKPARLRDYHFLVIPGGFSYGDDLGAGRVLGNELKTKLLPELQKFVRDGKLVIGICNGFQIMVKAGLLPDPLRPDSSQLTLANNDSGKFEDRWIRLKVSSTKSEFLKEEEVIELPVAHGEGKFLPRDADVLRRWEQGGQLVLKYVDPEGRENPAYPWNPNGAVANVAGMCDPTGRVLGLMPHPERFQDAVNHPRWTRGKDTRAQGLKFFRNACEYVKRNLSGTS